MGHVVELSDNIVQQLRSSESMLSLYLWTEVAEDDDCREVGSYENRAD